MDALSSLLEITKPFWDTINMIHFDITLAVILILVVVLRLEKRLHSQARKVKIYWKGPNLMTEKISGDIKKDLGKACALHQRTVSDYEKC